MTELLGRYDRAADRLCPDRTYFLNLRKDSPIHVHGYLITFPAVGKSERKKGNTVAYDFRHNYATANINSWKDDTFEFNDRLHYLARSMGHRCTESTLYYYSVVPRLADMIQEKQRKVSTALYRRWLMKNNKEAARMAGYISEFLHDYAPQFLTSSEHTLKSYRDALTLYIVFLEKSITHDSLGRHCFERDFIEEWIIWLKDVRHSSPETCNIRLGSLRAFLEFLGNKEVGLLYLYQEAKLIKRQKCQKRKVEGLTREAVAAILAAPDPSTRTGKRDLVFLTLLYATAARLDEILSMCITGCLMELWVTLFAGRGKAAL